MLKVMYHSPLLNSAGIIAALLHTYSISAENSGEVFTGLQKDRKYHSNGNPYLSYYGKGELGEDVYAVLARFPGSLLLNSLSSILKVCNRNPGDLIIVDPLPGKSVFLRVALKGTSGGMLPRNKMAGKAVKEINACVERTRLQVELLRKGVEERRCLSSTSASEEPILP